LTVATIGRTVDDQFSNISTASMIPRPIVAMLVP
jgi:hypothetical protein